MIHAVRNGYAVVVINCGEVLDPILNSILDGRDRVANIGVEEVSINDNFRLYLITPLQNPHYTPQTLKKITLLNFNITQLALKDQMLSILTKEEDPKLEEEKIILMNEKSENQ